MPKILIVVDPEETRHSALKRIEEIPVGSIDFKVDYYLQSPQSAEDACDYQDKIKEKKEWLESLVQPLRDKGYVIDTEIQIFYRLYETIIQSALKYGADFVFKPLRQHGAIKRALFTSTDWNLIRFCPCPLLLVNHANPINGNPVVAAVDLASQDHAHQQLNKVVLEQSGILANVLSADVHIVHAYNIGTVPSGNAVSDPLAYQITKGRRDEQFATAYKLAETQDIPRKNVHLGEGAADLVVNRYASQIEAGVIVIGTVARSGTSGLFIGNTAESVMEKTRSDVFVVKLEDFESPVKAA
jgi:universal stress protein E